MMLRGCPGRKHGEAFHIRPLKVLALHIHPESRCLCLGQCCWQALLWSRGGEKGSWVVTVACSRACVTSKTANRGVENLAISPLSSGIS